MLRIIYWNCQGGFRKKTEPILNLNPDIIIVSECEELSSLKDLCSKASGVIRIGNPRKGLAIFSFNGIKLNMLSEYNEDFEYILPIQATHTNFSFILFGIWAKNNPDYSKSYIRQVWRALHYYLPLLQTTLLITGDFNSNTIWDQKRVTGNHSDVVKLLAKENFLSIYHHQNKEKQGCETLFTFFKGRDILKGYHIDYSFISKQLLTSTRLKETDTIEWLNYSDHIPLIMDFNFIPQYQLPKDSWTEALNRHIKNLDISTQTKFIEEIKALYETVNNEGDFESKEIIAVLEHLKNINTSIQHIKSITCNI
ncbi:endonuclease/exonuclease/phosphatase family protein [Bacteroides propionicifaciens]|uniref:endonuclease/exonuclease/phosphatase family protein n=1 Tax=Bacteroides propionicifaciens TaxID=392838 RepID=UPI00035EB0DA|nr:endonuclease/exonuclease/phosphatase family protein [Bacteroides propionicifaciens]